MFKKLLLVLVVIIAAFLAYAATRPDTYRVERATKIDAPAEVVFSKLEDFRQWPAWSPWEKRDPQMKKTFEGPASGVGSSYSWVGNKDVGAGKMTIVASQPPSKIGYKLEFIEPFNAVAATEFTLVPQGERAVAITWAMEGTNKFIGKVFGVFMNMDRAIGGDFEAGLTALKATSESEQRNRDAAKAAADAAQAAQAAQAASDAAAAAAASAAAAAATPPAPNGGTKARR